MIRVLQVIGSLNSGGSQSMIMNIYRNIDKEKIQFDFIVDRPNELLYAKEIEKLGGKIYILPQYKIYNHAKFKKCWNDFFKEHNEYKIIHGHVRSTASIYLKIAKKYGLCTIAHSHSTSNGKGFVAIIKKILQYKIRYVADYFMGCSKEANEWLYGKKIANSERCIILHNAIDVEKYIYNEDIRNKSRKELNIEENEMVIGNIGRFSYMKNHKFLIDIFERLCKTENCKLLLVGDGELKNDIQNMIINKHLENKVILTGVRSDVNEILQAMDIFVMPSIFEGLPVTLVEAQVSGLPCLISEHITNEISLTKLIYRERLNSSAETWAERIKNMSLNINRYDHIYSEDVKKNGYDIIEIARQVEKIYTEKVK